MKLVEKRFTLSFHQHLKGQELAKYRAPVVMETYIRIIRDKNHYGKLAHLKEMTKRKQ